MIRLLALALLLATAACAQPAAEPRTELFAENLDMSSTDT